MNQSVKQWGYVLQNVQGLVSLLLQPHMNLFVVYSLALTIETLAITTVFLICLVYNVGPHTVYQ